MPEQQVGVFIAGQDPAMASAREVIQRAIGSYNGYFAVSESPDDAGIVMSVIGSQHEEAVTQFLKGVRALGKRCHVFALKGVERDEALETFLKEFEGVEWYTNARMLGTAAVSRMGRFQMAMFPGWRNPPVPARDPFFAGRATDIETLSAALLEDLPVVISGPSGIGKSALALEIVHNQRHRLTGGIFWIDSLGGQGNTLAQAWRILAEAHRNGRLAAAQQHELQVSDVQSWLVDAPGRGVIVVDNVADLNLLREFYAVIPFNFALLAITSSTMDDAGWKNHSVQPLNQQDGMELLRKILEVPQNISHEMMAPLESLISLLKGHALSMRLATEWLKRMGGWRAGLLFIKRLGEAENILDKLQLSMPGYDYAEKVFSVIYKLLTPQQQRLIRSLGVFSAGTMHPDALVTVGKVSHDDLAELFGFIHYDEIDGGYRTHNLIRSYGAALLAVGGEAFQMKHDHLNYYLHYAGRQIHNQATAADVELNQYRAAFIWAVNEKQDSVLPFLMTVGQWLYMQQQFEELSRWLDGAMKLTPMTEGTLEMASTLRALGDLAVRIDRIAVAREYYDRALMVYYQTKSLSGQANTLKVLGDLSARENRLGNAQEYYDRTLQLYAQIDFQLGRANTLKALGDLSVQGDDLKSAKNYYERTLELYEQIEFQLGQAHTLKSMGDLCVRTHDWTEAEDAYKQALSIYNEIKFASQEAVTFIALGDLQLSLGVPNAALQAYEGAMNIYRSLDDKAGQATILKTLGRLHQQQGQQDEAAQKYREAIAISQETHAAGEEAILNQTLGLLRIDQDNYEAGVRHLLNANRIFESLNVPRHIEESQNHLREVARKLGEAFADIWKQASDDAEMPEWLRKVPQVVIPQELIYAVRDFMIADNWAAARRIVERHKSLMLTDVADEVFARMLRQYAGQPGPTRQIDKYRALLQRCRQIGIEEAFDEIEAPATSSEANRAARLYQSLDAYAEALERLKDIPLVFASIQLNRAGTLREIAALPEQESEKCLQMALEAYDSALVRQKDAAPLDYAQTQILRAEALNEVAGLPGQDKKQLLLEMLAAYEEALQQQRSLPTDYARTLTLRAKTLHRLAEQPGEDMTERMEAALKTYEEVLSFQEGLHSDYARTQSERAQLLYEMAGLPGQDFNERMWQALAAYDEALEHLRNDDPLQYARTESRRVALLRDMAGLPGEDRTARLYQALAASNEALLYLRDEPIEYARTQVVRAHLLREIAGLRGEHRLARMREAVATYNEAVRALRSMPLEYVQAQVSHAAILREMGGLSGENRTKRLRQSLEAAAEALNVLEDLDNASQLRNARRMMVNTRKEILQTEGEDVFKRWWDQYVGSSIPDWLAD